jgi:hypothetical protein
VNDAIVSSRTRTPDLLGRDGRGEIVNTGAALERLATILGPSAPR